MKTFSELTRYQAPLGKFDEAKLRWPALSILKNHNN
jgi:hypothetical protein